MKKYGGHTQIIKICVLGGNIHFGQRLLLVIIKHYYIIINYYICWQ